MTTLVNHKEASWAIRDIQDDSLTTLEQHFLLIALSCSNKNFIFQRSYQDLAKIMRCSKRSITYKVNLLLKKQYLSIVSLGNNITHEATKFRINMNKILSTLDAITRNKILKAGAVRSPGLVQITTKAGAPVAPLASTEAIGTQTAAIAPLGATDNDDSPSEWVTQLMKNLKGIQNDI